jgi:sigma-E factor negative regulatory protein RseB
MRSVVLAGWLLSLTGAVVSPSTYAQSATELLQRMDSAFSQLAYDGVFSYLNGDELASLRVVHKIVDGVQRERLVHLNGAPREIIRHGERVACIVMPGDDLLALEKSIPSGPFARAFVRQFDRISNTYTVGEYGEGRVAGRKAVRVAVSPKDQHRYGYRLWLDEETSLLLRSELVDHEGNKLEIFMFNQVRLGEEVADAALEPVEAQGSMVSHLTLRPAPGQRQPDSQADDATQPASQWRARWLPAGFEMTTADLRRKPLSGHAVNSLMYSDGLAAFSIYIEPMPDNGAASMMSKNGATVAVTGKVSDAQGHYLVTLVGEIPLPTAQEIIASVVQKK